MTRTLSVPDMTCRHCKATVEEALMAVPGVHHASVDLDSKIVSVEHADAVTEKTLRAAVLDAGYSVAEGQPMGGLEGNA